MTWHPYSCVLFETPFNKHATSTCWYKCFTDLEINVGPVSQYGPTAFILLYEPPLANAIPTEGYRLTCMGECQASHFMY